MNNRRGLIRPGRIASSYKTNISRAAENPVTSTSTRIKLTRRSRSFSEISRPLSSIENSIKPKPIFSTNQPNLTTNRNVESVTSGQMDNRRGLIRPGRIASTFKTSSAAVNPITSSLTMSKLRRRSKSVSEIYRPLSSIPENKTGTKALFSTNQSKLATKRKVESAISDPVISKTSKLQSRALSGQQVSSTSQKSTNQKPTTTVKRPTPAPYDFKGRFQILQEKHTLLKEKYSEMKEKCERMEAEIEPLRNDHEELIIKREQLIGVNTQLLKAEEDTIELKDKNEKMTTELNELKIKHEKVQGELNKATAELKTLKIKTQDLKIQNDALEVQVPHLLSQVIEADKQRRMMHNMIQDLKGNIRVFCRVRPPLQHELNNHLIEFKYNDSSTIEISNNSTAALARRMPKQEFAFTQVFNERSTQADVFSELGDLVHSVLDGYNVCVFAYGQTGSGKTYTMEGGLSSETMGMIPRTVDLLFHSIEDLKLLHWEYSVTASFIEIYNDQIYDLLSNDDLPHEIKMSDTKGTDLYVTNIQQVQIFKSNDLKHYLNDAQRNRAQAKTYMNERSSRSHAVTKIEIQGLNTQTNQQFTASLSLVDLAGSEKARDSEVVRLTETKNINKSLSTLSNVILALMQKREHIPYRDSKLTHLLMPSLGGNSKCLMFANISPLTDNYSETLNTLRFASNVITCKVGTAKRNF